MVTNQTVCMLQEKSAIPLSCYLQIWLNLRSCYCNQCYRQQTARQAQMSAWSWKNQHISSAVSLNTKYSDPSSEFESSIFCKSATRHIHFNFIRSQYWPSQLYIYKPLWKYNQQSQMLLSSSTGICNTRSVMSPSLKAESQYIAENQKRWLQNYSLQVMPVLCSDGILGFSEWQGTLNRRDIILQMKIPLMFAWWKNWTSP